MLYPNCFLSNENLRIDLFQFYVETA